MNDGLNPTSPGSQPSSDREHAIFDGATQLPPEKRAEYIALACGNNDPLRQRVEVLLQAHERSGGFMAEPAAPTARSTIVLAVPPTEKTGDRIGRYKLLQQIGEGGCGVVYMAEQEEPVLRRVALKVIKLGMDTKSVIARFEAERQALALMDHPNIAKVLDAGATENGRPFFVMELVRGIKFTDYCDQNRLSTVERLGLFTQVCNAIQHAHQKGIIHRDIKPSNILVTSHDGVPVPKVIDFGIAKATQGKLTDQTLFTAFEQFIGTPAYMSPEQAEMSGLDVDTRSDIYALGVLLYELLTGWTPFDPKELLQSGIDELRRTIREKEPARPSTRLSTMLDADLTAVAQRRHSDAPRLIHSLRGDLDWIVMKALEKDRTRRYETANGLAADIQRYLTNEPVVARPPSTLYRFQKFVRRNKIAVTAGTAAVLALVLGLAISTVLFAKERAARKRADEAERRQRALTEEAAYRAKLGQQIGLAALYMTQGKIEESENEIATVPVDIMTNHVAIAAIFNYIAEKHARHGQWRQAITNFEKMIVIVPKDFHGHTALAALLARVGDRQAYDQHCERMLREFAGSSDPEIAAATAADCAILPPPPGALDAIAKVADTALAAGSNHQHWADIQFAKGLIEYRRGHYKDALNWTKAALGVPEADTPVYAESRIVLALARQQLDRPDDAQSTLADGLDYMKHKMPGLDGGLGDRWNDWVAANVLLSEARKMIEKPAP